MHVPFNRMTPLGRERDYVAEAIAGTTLGAGGDFARRCEEILSRRTGGGTVLVTKSCTGALELSVRLLGLGPGDEVIMPSFTFVSAANAVCLMGAVPRFVDIDARTLNISPAAVARAIGPKTRAIMPVHYGGRICDMDRLRTLADTHGLAIVEDAAHALGSVDDHRRPAGGFGELATFSFHETKNVGCGEGGALVVNDPALVERAYHFRDKGTNRRAFEAGEIDKYTWVDVGTSLGLSEVLAAFLLGQLEHLDTATTRRRRLYTRYRDAFAAYAARGAVCLPPPVGSSNAHVFHLLLPDSERRRRFLSGMGEHEARAVFHYVPLHRSPAARRLGLGSETLPVTEDVADRLVRLPLFATLTDEEQDHVIASAQAVLDAF